VGSHQLPFGHRRDEIGNETYPVFSCCHILHLLLLANWEDTQCVAVFAFAGLHVDTKELSHHLALPVLLNFERAIIDDIEPSQLFQNIYLIAQDRRYFDQLLIIRIVGERNAIGVRVYETCSEGSQLLALLVGSGVRLHDRTGPNDNTQYLFNLASSFSSFGAA
jgi:hypothetical protein